MLAPLNTDGDIWLLCSCRIPFNEFENTVAQPALQACMEADLAVHFDSNGSDLIRNPIVPAVHCLSWRPDRPPHTTVIVQQSLHFDAYLHKLLSNKNVDYETPISQFQT